MAVRENISAHYPAYGNIRAGHVPLHTRALSDHYPALRPYVSAYTAVYARKTAGGNSAGKICVGAYNGIN